MTGENYNDFYFIRNAGNSCIIFSLSFGKNNIHVDINYYFGEEAVSVLGGFHAGSLL